MGYPSLLSSFGRLIAVASSVSNVDVYDANNVVELQHVLGSGACKFKLLGSFPVCDASGNVELSYIQFLSGGGLLVAGNTYQGSGECWALGCNLAVFACVCVTSSRSEWAFLHKLTPVGASFHAHVQ